MPDPLHPAIVHFPIVLACLSPVVALWGLLSLRRGGGGAAWRAAVVVLTLVVLTGWVSMRTGRAQEERVEHVVPERLIHEHEEAAERLVYGALALLILALAGCRRGATARALRVVVLAGTVALVLAAIDTGRRGGALVYEHGAASAYVPATPGAERERGLRR